MASMSSPSAQAPAGPPPAAAGAPVPAVVLKPTNHPPLPTDPPQAWLVPSKPAAPRTAAITDFVAAVKLEVDSNFAKALPIVSRPAVQQGTLGGYAEYYQGLAELRIGRPADARRTFRSLAAKNPVGYLVEATALREAECAEALGEQSAAMDIYSRLAATKTTAPDDVLMRLGRSARAAGDLTKATEAFGRVVYEFPFSDLAIVASDELQTLPIAPIAAGTTRYKLELGRAERLFGAKRYPPAKLAFEGVQGSLDRVTIASWSTCALAECDFFLKRARNARDALKPYTEKSARQGEALYFYAVSIRELGDQSGYLAIVRRLVDEFSAQSWAEEALNNLATFQILKSDDQGADATFREMVEKYPTGHYADRASWKVGWFAYRSGRFADAIRVFEPAAAHFPRSDYRPSWLYWSARAHEALHETAIGDARYRLVATDYLNSYYGRLSLDAARRPRAGDSGSSSTPQANVQPPPAADSTLTSRPAMVAAAAQTSMSYALLSLDLWDQAIDELHYAAKAWGDSSAIQATLAWIYEQQGRAETGAAPVQFVPRRDQHHEARVPAVPRVRRRDAAAGDPADHLSDRVLGSDSQARGRIRPRPVRRGRAHGAGVHLRAGHRVLRESGRPDAARAGDGARSTLGGS